jgi:hypothetical protein
MLLTSLREFEKQCICVYVLPPEIISRKKRTKHVTNLLLNFKFSGKQAAPVIKCIKRHEAKASHIVASQITI